jgi:two-component SAPR family response regulator
MVKMNCIVVDDEVMGRKLMEENVKKIPFLHLVGSCSNAFEAMELLQKEQVDLLFLDIQMPGLLGTSFLSSLEALATTLFRGQCCVDF